MRFHHIGIPTDASRDGETFLEGTKVHVTDPREDPYGIEWVRFEPDSPLPDQLKSGFHLAFQVPDLEAALDGQNVLIEPFEPMDGVRAAFIVHQGVPVELMQVAT